MQFFNVVKINKAVKRLSKKTRFQLGTETLPLSEASGRILATDLLAPRALPPFGRSVVDGFAVRSEDVSGASEGVPTVLNINGVVMMGSDEMPEVTPGGAVYVPTGAMLPHGADAMVMIEYVEYLDGSTICVTRPAPKGYAVVLAGEECEEGELLLPRGTMLQPEQVALAAAAGYDCLDVYIPPRCAIISTGDELVAPGLPLLPGQIHDVNSELLAGLVVQDGGAVCSRVRIGDDREVFRGALADALAVADFVLISGGSSVGEHDYTAEVIASFNPKNELLVHGLAIRPGKPTIIGIAQKKVVIGLPGHPVSAGLVYRALVRPWLDNCFGRSRRIKSCRAVMTEPVHATPGCRTYQPVEMISREGELPGAKPLRGKSGMISLLARADGYVIMSSSQEGLEAGEAVEVFLM